MDIAINFRSSYQDHRTKRIVLEGRQIAGHYLRFYFWVGLLSSFPDRIVLTWVRMLAQWLALKFDSSIDVVFLISFILWETFAHPLIQPSQLQLSEDKRNLIKYDLFHCVSDDRSMDFFRCFWDLVAILSMLKFLQMPLFFKYLVNHLKRRNRSSYYIKIVKVGLNQLIIVFQMFNRMIFSEPFNGRVLLSLIRVHKFSHLQIIPCKGKSS